MLLELFPAHHTLISSSVKWACQYLLYGSVLRKWVWRAGWPMGALLVTSTVGDAVLCVKGSLQTQAEILLETAPLF